MKCPYCGEEIQNDATKCKYCREWINVQNNSIETTKSEGKINIGSQNNTRETLVNLGIELAELMKKTGSNIEDINKLLSQSGLNNYEIDDILNKVR